MVTIVPTGDGSSFHEVRMPDDISVGATGGPNFKTTILTLGSGQEMRRFEWAEQRAEYQIGTGLQSLDDARRFLNFFYARMGKAYGFRFRDWSDLAIEDQAFTVGDGRVTMTTVLNSGPPDFGCSNTFQLYKEYDNGDFAYLRPILKPAAFPEFAAPSQLDAGGRGIVQLNGTPLSYNPAHNIAGNYQIDWATGLVTIWTVGGTPLVNGDIVHLVYLEFDVPVRFDTDKVELSMAAFEAGEWKDIPLIELKQGK